MQNPRHIQTRMKAGGVCMMVLNLKREPGPHGFELPFWPLKKIRSRNGNDAASILWVKVIYECVLYVKKVTYISEIDVS